MFDLSHRHAFFNSYPELQAMFARCLTPIYSFLVVTCAAGTVSAQDEPDLSQYYGFKELEIFKVEDRSGNLLSADINGDGLTDLILVDNSHSRIDILQQRKDKNQPAEKRTGSDVNAVPNTSLFQHVKVPVDREIVALAEGDFNGDRKTDLAYIGSPDQLIVRFQNETGGFGEKKTFRVPDLTESSWTLAAGDLTGDGRDDLVVLGEDETTFVHQNEDGTLDVPRAVRNTSSDLALAMIADLNGDGRNDLCYTAGQGQDTVACTRLQRPDGQLGPELRFEIGQPRAITLQNINRDPRTELLTIDSRTNRAVVFQLSETESDEQEKELRLIQFGFGDKGTGRDRDLAVGDLDGDGRNDVVATDPETAQMLVFRQQGRSGLDLGTAYPGLMGASQVRIADFSRDGAAEVVVLSPKEKSLGVSRFESGRLTFPQPLPTEEEPVAFDLADVNGDGRLEVVYVSRQREGRSSKYSLRALAMSEAKRWQATTFGRENAVELEITNTPEKLTTFDANNDGRPDFLLFLGSGRPAELIVTGVDGTPAMVDTGGGIQLGDSEAGGVFMLKGDQPTMLVAQENFARRMKLGKNNRWSVLDQYNATGSSAKIVGTAVLDLDGEAGDEIVLVDSGVNKLRLLKRQENLYRPWREVELGDFPFIRTEVADMDADGRNDLILVGRSRFAVLHTGRTEPELIELATFETKLDDTYFLDLIAGDVNGDGYCDVVLLDSKSHMVEVLDYDPKLALRHGLHFKLYESKSFTGSGDTGSEPREGLIADVTGDGSADIVLLAHDRVLVLPQDPGE